MARTKGAAKLSDDKRARILAKKNAHLSTHKKIALEEGVSRNTVVKLKESDLSPEVLNLSRSYETEIRDELKTIAMMGIANTKAKMHELNAKDSMTVAAIAIDKSQLLAGAPTAITQTADTDLSFARELFRRLIERRGFTVAQASEFLRADFPGLDPKLLTEGLSSADGQ